MIDKILVSNQGAELQSIFANGREYLWQGDPSFWSRRAPILFPIVGRLADDTLRIDGASYKMKQHGFARDAEFVERDGWYEMVHDKPYDNYPYEFKLKVCYLNHGNILDINWEVQNIGKQIMYFQIGAHPAFVLPDYNSSHYLHGYFRCYDSNGNTVLPITSSRLIDGLRHKNAPMVLGNKEAMIAITDNTFINDAVLLEGGNVSSVGLLDVKGNEILRVICPQAQVFGLWAPNKNGCPFVCIEPWCGVADKCNFIGEFSERNYTQSIDAGNKYSFNYSILINQTNLNHPDSIINR